MTTYKHWLLIALGLIALVLATQSSVVRAERDRSNTVTLINRSGNDALVALVGPTRVTVKVPDGTSQTVNVAAGSYELLARYDEEKRYRYGKGEPFTVTQTTTQYSVISITLHKVVDGNYTINDASEREFEAAYRGGVSEGFSAEQGDPVTLPQPNAAVLRVPKPIKLEPTRILVTEPLELHKTEPITPGTPKGPRLSRLYLHPPPDEAILTPVVPSKRDVAMCKFPTSWTATINSNINDKNFVLSIKAGTTYPDFGNAQFLADVVIKRNNTEVVVASGRIDIDRYVALRVATLSRTSTEMRLGQPGDILLLRLVVVHGEKTCLVFDTDGENFLDSPVSVKATVGN